MSFAASFLNQQNQFHKSVTNNLIFNRTRNLFQTESITCRNRFGITCILFVKMLENKTGMPKKKKSKNFFYFS